MAENKKKKNTLTCEWRETKGRMNPLPRCMAVQLSDLALYSVKTFEMMRHQKTTEEKDIQWLAGEWPRCRFEWDWSLSAFASLLCLQCTITCHIYSQKMHIWLLFFLSFHIHFNIFLLIFARSRKLLGHWAKPYMFKKKKKKKKCKPQPVCLYPAIKWIGFPIMP